MSDIPPGGRSPSPEPIFDRSGAQVQGRAVGGVGAVGSLRRLATPRRSQVNSREARRRQQLINERAELLESLKPKVPQRCWRKLIVPVDKYPGYNFFGAIIGPRGNAQKRMARTAEGRAWPRAAAAAADAAARVCLVRSASLGARS